MTVIGSTEPPPEVLSRFPRAEPTIRRRFGEDEKFRELCDDYVECLLVIERLRQQQRGTGEQFEQYCELSLNLEQELESRISPRKEAHVTPPGPGEGADLSTHRHPDTDPLTDHPNKS
ncbi:hypothetical protein [Haloferula sp. A504]|uniref:hypothetical protein n=1 Tax=Haloferula sp. A504 TaxID=3373601 RepID=UPI0031C5B808|nr:hypothetical protein [Verrucomicrobiaceae bacterium E54]